MRARAMSCHATSYEITCLVMSCQVTYRATHRARDTLRTQYKYAGGGPTAAASAAIPLLQLHHAVRRRSVSGIISYHVISCHIMSYHIFRSPLDIVSSLDIDLCLDICIDLFLYLNIPRGSIYLSIVLLNRYPSCVDRPLRVCRSLHHPLAPISLSS